MKSLNINWIIHPFAILHMLVAFTCRSLGIMDEIWLTMLTIAMVVLIGLRSYTKVELIAATAIVINAVGYLSGIYGAKLFGMLLPSDLLSHGISTMITTEIVGWLTYGFLGVIRKNYPERKDPGNARFIQGGEKLQSRHVLWLTGALVILLCFRILMTLIFSGQETSQATLVQTIDIIMARSWILAIMVFFVILFVRHLQKKHRKMAPAAKTVAVAGSAILISAAAALIIGIDSYGRASMLTARRFFQIFTVILALYLIIYSIIYMMDYILTARAAVNEERDKADFARYRYDMLKRQVNPHFLFNSLNILDCMVLNGKNAQASAYIHKLAGIYRYMLQNAERSVALKDELEFVSMYVDLLRERFADGFEVSVDIPEDKMHLQVVPCSLQMLIENAIKHNRVGGDTVLGIRIYTEGRMLCVSNNLLPKVSEVPSTKVGLDYLRTQYMNLCGSSIRVSDTGGEYKVMIPLIQ